MSVILVWKGKSACMVNKQRDPGHKGKYIEKYLGSMGVISKEEMILRRDKMYVFDTDHERIMFAKHAFHFEETKKDIPRRKDKTQISGQIKPKSKKQTTKKKQTKEYKPKIVWKTRPWQKKGNIAQQKTIEDKKEQFKDKESIKIRIKAIKDRMRLAKSIIAQKKNVKTFTKTEQASTHAEIKYQESVIESGHKAIRILRKKREVI